MPLRSLAIKQRLITGMLLLLSIAGPCSAALPLEFNGQTMPSLAPMLELVTPAVVNISTISEIRTEEHPLLSDPFFKHFFNIPRYRQKKRHSSLGSGVIIDAARGHVLTNHHVIDKALEIQVTLKDGRKLSAELIGSDPEIDVALLRIPHERLTELPLADSDALRVGDFVVAIGNPFGLTQTVTSGIVSALGRSGLGIEGYENFIQTDASINPGNSGGPLVNLRGELVGLNTAIVASGGGNVGIGFAIPINMAHAIVQQILRFGGVQRGVFGIEMQGMTPDLAQALGVSQQQGAVVVRIKPGSSAEVAGMEIGDIIETLNGRPMENPADVENALALLRVGDDVDIQVLRDSRRLRLSAKIADPLEGMEDGSTYSISLAGSMIGEVVDNSPYGEYEAIEVGRVRKGSQAWQKGVREGDILLTINNVRVKSLKILKRTLKEAQEIYQVKLRRGSRIITLISR